MPDPQATDPDSITEQDVKAFARSYTLFNDTLTKLQDAYRSLECRFDTLNRELEETNRRLQSSLEEKERLSGYLENTLESLGSGVIAVDTEGRITLFNRAASALLEWPVGDARNLRCEEVLGDGSEDLLRALNTGEGVQGGEKTLSARDGREIPVRYSTTCLRSGDGDVIGGIETFEDISKLQELSRQASRVSTLTALGEMAATVAHEIRNPLGGIGGFAGLLERDLEVDDPRRRLVKKMIEGVESLNRLVTNLLNYTRPLQLNLRPIDFIQVVEDCIGFFEIDAGNLLEQIEVDRRYAAPEIQCQVDPEQIQQIALNLLHNAVQAMPGGGQLTIGITEVDAEADERTSLTTSCIALTVADTGMGMTPEVQSKLFMPFFTTKEDGNGLGLATARKVIEAHRGDILVESEPDQGSAFTIYIPTSLQ